MIQAGGQLERVGNLWGALLGALAFLLLLVVAHDVDHVVNEQRLGELSAAFWVFLPLQYGAFLAVLFSTWRRYEAAPTLAVALGATSIIAFVGAHLLPFGLLPYADGEPLAISWALVFVPIAAAIAVIAISLRLRAAIPGRARAHKLGAS
jgi:hypothetical protein